MTYLVALKLKKVMPSKKMFFDTCYNCYRLINPQELYEYRDAEGKCHKRENVDQLVPV